jgi:hypothetical protein
MDGVQICRFLTAKGYLWRMHVVARFLHFCLYSPPCDARLEVTVCEAAATSSINIRVGQRDALSATA